MSNEAIINEIYNKIQSLPIVKEIHYVLTFNNMINFDIYLGKKFLLGIGTTYKKYNNNNEVMFSITLNKKVIFIGELPIDELIKKVIEVYNKI